MVHRAVQISGVIPKLAKTAGPVQSDGWRILPLDMDIYLLRIHIFQTCKDQGFGVALAPLFTGIVNEP